ncbi:MAG: 4'-phosphopantetheinyl transferase family protein [Gemmatimonadales bacterium]
MSDKAWRAVREVPPLDAGEVHVWLDDLRASPPWAAGELLSPEERDQALRFSAAPRRDTFVRGRAFLRFLAGRHLATPASAVPLRIMPSGKPVIDVPAGAAPLWVNLAHSGNVLAVAVTRSGEVGVDVEAEDRAVDRDAIARRFFSDAEARALAALPEAAEPAAFIAAWVCKEAVLKAVGDGLAIPLREVELAITPSSPDSAPRLLRVPADYGSIAEWSLLALAPRPGMAGAVAVRAPGVRLRCFRWSDARRL